MLSVRFLLDTELTLKHHVNRISSRPTCFYHLCRLREGHVVVEVMKQLIGLFIFSRLDYCNALLISLPFYTIAISFFATGAERLK